MSDESFTHEEGAFDPAEMPETVGVSDAEAKYAKIVAEVIWDGVITEEKRQRLQTAAEMFKLSPTRARQIEQSITASHEASHGAVVDETTAEMDHDLEPLVASDEPGIKALQSRIAHLEKQVHELERENADLGAINEGLEELVTQLQQALDSTLEELDEVSQGLEPEDDDGPVSSVKPLPPPETSPGLPAPPDAAPPVADLDDSVEVEPPDLGSTPVPAATNPGYLSPNGSPVQAEPDAPVRREQRWRSRRVIRESAPPPAIVEMRKRRQNPVEIHKLFVSRPDDLSLLHQLFAALERGDDLDRRWCIAHALVFLGEANDAEREVFVDHAVAGLVKPSRAVNDDEWRELLFHPDEDPTTGSIFGAIAPAVLLGHMTAARASLAPEVIEADKRIDPASSKVDAARCIKWAAAALGMELPPLYACPEQDHVADLVLNPTPSVRFGKHALVGRNGKELAFIAGSTLSWYRKEHVLGKPTKSVRRLEDVFLAAVMIGNPGLPMSSDIKKRVTPIVDTIRPLLDEEATKALKLGFSRFVEQGGRTNLSRWYKAAERTAACAGLLLANDLHAAKAVLELQLSSGREAPENTVEEAMRELIIFFTAARCSMLRKRIGISVKTGEG